MVQKVIRVGHSLAVVIPSKVTRLMGIKAGDPVNIRTRTEKGKVIMTFEGTQQLPLSLQQKN